MALNEEKLKLLNYIGKNFIDVIKPAQGGEYIEIDLIPDGHDGLHDLTDIIDSCNKNGIDIDMLIRSYPMNFGDGIRMGRYMYFMQETTREILNDLKDLYPNIVTFINSKRISNKL
jgi:hypothetical protein